MNLFSHLKNVCNIWVLFNANVMKNVAMATISAEERGIFCDQYCRNGRGRFIFSHYSMATTLAKYYVNGQL